MTGPFPALAPVIPPTIDPTVHEKLLGTEDVRLILGLTPLHIVAVLADVTIGFGVTVTVIVNGKPTHSPPIDVGVTTYCTVPDVVLVGLFNT